MIWYGSALVGVQVQGEVLLMCIEALPLAMRILYS